ncbi:hypothetical protein MRX96_037352 [Rhipicephalus microplus]
MMGQGAGAVGAAKRAACSPARQSIIHFAVGSPGRAGTPGVLRTRLPHAASEGGRSPHPRSPASAARTPAAEAILRLRRRGVVPGAHYAAAAA